MNADAFSLSASMPFSASDGEKVAQPDEVSPESGERNGVRCRNAAIQWLPACHITARSDLSRLSSAKAEAIPAAIQSAQAAGFSN